MNDGGPAFPVPPNETQQADSGHFDHPQGMSLRDWFAGQALAGMCTHYANQPAFGLDSEIQTSISQLAYEQADSMIAEREKK
jgi:hypothetical protein